MERYESLGLVGEGSYGTVLKCRHRDSGRLVAIKKFLDSDDDKTVKKIALREIKLLRQLRHDNLVNLLEVWKRRRRWYLVFEFVERTLLDELEQNPNGLDLNTSRQYLYQILRAAAFCHQQNIIHRDIKPENILISQGGVIKLCDFGFARTVASPAEGGVYTDYVATRWYRPPELLVGDTKYGKPVDVWAVGCLLMEMLTSQPLFPGDSDLDQIYHIVRCFGNLTAHHQELFHRNPVFSGVRLPECFNVIPLEQRFPIVTPTALDLAQSCLQMDPDERAQCSELLEHPLFTHDSFHIRFSDELNAKIQKDHRENSTLPKIPKTARHARDEGDEKDRRGKDKKQPEDVDEKVNKEKGKRDKAAGEDKTTKTKNKQSSKLSKAGRNTSEPLMSTKQSKTLGSKGVDNAVKPPMAMKSKLGKASDAGLKSDLNISESTKTVTSNTATGLKDNNTLTAKPKHGKVASPEPGEDRSKHLADAKDRDSSGFSSKTLVASKPQRSANSEPNPKFMKSSDKTETKVFKLSESSTTQNPDVGSTPVDSLELSVDRTDMNTTLKLDAMSITGSFESTSIAVMTKMSNSSHLDTNATLHIFKVSSSDVTQSVDAITKPFEMTLISKHQTHESTMDKDLRSTSECLKVLPSKQSETSPNFGAKTLKNSTSSPSSLLKTSNLSTQSIHQGNSNPKFSKNTSASDTKTTNDTTWGLNKPSKVLPADKGQNTASAANINQQDSGTASNKDGLMIGVATKTATDNIHTSDASGRDFREEPNLSEPSSIHQQSTSKSKTPDKVSQTTYLNPSHFTKGLKVSDKENREDLALSLSTSASTKSVITQTLKVSRCSDNEQTNHGSEPEPEGKSFHSKSLIVEPKTKPGSLGNHTRATATMTSRTLKPFPTDAKRKSDLLERNDAVNSSTVSDSASVMSMVPPEQRDSTKISALHNIDTAHPNEFNLYENTNPSPSTPPPPPPPSSTPLLLPPSSTPLIPTFSVIGTNRPAAGSEHLSLGTGFPSTSLRYIEKPRLHGSIYSRLAPQPLSSHISSPLPSQVSDKSLTRERSFLSEHCNLGNSGGVAAVKKKSDVHLPDVRSSVLPELQGREGKHYKSVMKDQRKDSNTKQTSSSSSEPHGHNSADTYKP